MATAALVVPMMIAIAPVAAATAPWTQVFEQTRPPAESRSLRGVALSPDGSSVYGTWLQGTTSVVKYDAATGAPEDTAAFADQPKALAVDSRGNVFAGSGSASPYPYIKAFSADLQTQYGSVTTPGVTNIQSKQFAGLATLDQGGHHYLYATRASGTDAFYIQRFLTDDVNAVTLDTSFGTGGTLNLQDTTGFSGRGYPQGIAVAADGTMYVAAFSQADVTAAGDTNAATGGVYRIAADGSSASFASVPGAWDVALHRDAVYVSQYGQVQGGDPAASAVTVLDSTTLATLDNLATGYANTNTRRDSGYSGIAVSAAGNVYLADQVYDTSQSQDRLLVSPAQSRYLAPVITSANSTNLAPNVAGSFTVTTAAATAPTATLSQTGTLPTGVTFTDNGDGTATLAGTPTQLGSFPITITASNGVGTDATQAFTLTSLEPNTVAFTSAPPSPANVGASYTVVATGSGSGSVTYSIGSASSAACSISGATVAFTAAGTCVIAAAQASDGTHAAGSAQQSVTVTAAPTPPVNRPPTAQSVSVSTVANTAVGVTLSGSDPDGDAVTYSHGGASHGTVTGSGASLTYTPAKDYAGPDSFSFTVSDGRGGTASGTVSITVVAAPSAPPVTTTVVAGGTATSTPAGGGSPSSPQPVVASVTSPVAGDVTFTPITTPPGAGSGSAYTFLSQSFIIEAPAATPGSPLALNFAIDTASLPAGTDPADLTVFRDGVAVPACTDQTAKIADPDPCVDTVESAAGSTSITVLSSHASTWTFGTKSSTAPSRMKVAGVKGVSPGGTEKVAVRVWNSDGTFAGGVAVTIAVAGANKANGVVTTDGKGFATFSYTPKKLGVDTVTAAAGTLSGTATVHIVRPGQRPVLGTVSRMAGTVNIAVQTTPVVSTRKVKIYAVHKVRGQKATLVYVGYGMTNAAGRAHVVITLGSGQSFVLKARMAGTDYVQHLSARSTGTVK